jgi:16S rRNA (cytosine967-C5)-methyltransferase
VRCPPGAALTAHPLYESGAFEIQDAAAQIAAALAEARPGMRVLDLAAGAGGKSLALAASMQNRGEIIACDVRPGPLAELERRAARAGVSIIRTHLLGEPPSDTEIGGPFDLVFLDAPCSGSGTWRRQPEAKWRLTAARLAELTALQDRLLDQAARLTGSGDGRLIYATCSILPCENEDRAAQFVAKYPRFRGLPPDFKASPVSTGTDGFYAARFVQA